ncbi:insulinase family protein [Agrobacterium tumefaciens]|nr:insulinase family protein [Agrobacterium tumefaciens]NTE21596.1 insulinase family protein [Agrobacterium tumefaciens]
MNTIKKIVLFSFIIFSAFASNAQNGMREPINYSLKNGMKIIVSENEKSQGAFSSFTLNTNAFQNKKDGIVELLNATLNESIAKNDQILFKDNSGRLATNNAQLEKGLTEMAAIIQHADINQKTFDSGKAALLTSLKKQNYDYDQTVNENSINAISLSDLIAFYNEISPEKTFLTVAGNVEMDTAKTAVKKAFGNWKKAEKPETSTIAK